MGLMNPAGGQGLFQVGNALGQRASGVPAAQDRYAKMQMLEQGQEEIQAELLRKREMQAEAKAGIRQRGREDEADAQRAEAAAQRAATLKIQQEKHLWAQQERERVAKEAFLEKEFRKAYAQNPEAALKRMTELGYGDTAMEVEKEILELKKLRTDVDQKTTDLQNDRNGVVPTKPLRQILSTLPAEQQEPYSRSLDEIDAQNPKEGGVRAVPYAVSQNQLKAVKSAIMTSIEENNRVAREETKAAQRRRETLEKDITKLEQNIAEARGPFGIEVFTAVPELQLLLDAKKEELKELGVSSSSGGGVVAEIDNL